MKKPKPRGKRRDTPLQEQIAMTFRYHEALYSMLRDFKVLDRLVCAESSRHGCLVKDENAAAIIEARKNRVLEYIQVVCEDNVFWGSLLLEDGFVAATSKKSRSMKKTLTLWNS